MSTWHAGSYAVKSVQAPQQFAMVEPGLYRCSYPLPENVSFIVNLGPKVILLLSYESLALPVVTQLRAAMGDQVKLVSVAQQSLWEQRVEFNKELVVAALGHMLNSEGFPTVVMCPTGTLQTSVVCGCLRKLQRWSLSSIAEECEMFVAPPARFFPRGVLSFIEGFNLEDCNAEPMLRPLLKASRAQQQPTALLTGPGGTATAPVSVVGAPSSPLVGTSGGSSVTSASLWEGSSLTGRSLGQPGTPLLRADEGKDAPGAVSRSANASFFGSRQGTGSASVLAPDIGQPPRWLLSQMEHDREDLLLCQEDSKLKQEESKNRRVAQDTFEKRVDFTLLRFASNPPSITTRCKFEKGDLIDDDDD